MSDPQRVPHDSYVAIDVETTGLDPQADRIIEVAATRFDRSGAAGHFSSLVDPGRPIPAQVQALTGIGDADVAGAPTITRVGAELAVFAGGRAVVGHNVRFDLDFLIASGIELAGAALDTWELASVLLPTAARLNLGSLAELLSVDMPVAHRALADAEATRDVFLRLLTVLDALPRAALIDLRAIAESADWGLAPLFAAAAERAATATPPAAGDGELAALTLPPPPAPPPPPERRDPPEPVTADDVERLFAAAVARPDLLPGFEPRSGQLEMAQAVAANVAHGGHLAVEGGTGTGKSLAYLLPTLLHVLRNGDRVVISTHTLNLQEQLAQRDIVSAAALVEAHEGAERGSLRAAVLKGRPNYLCLERWAEARRSFKQRSAAEARLHARVTTWLLHTQTADLAELYLLSDERPAWDALSAEGTDCLARRCAFVRDGSCFLMRARQRAAIAHAVVVNHALLLAGAAAESQVLPPFRHLVIDEAHRLEDVATRQYGATLSTRELGTLLDELAGGEGVAGRMRGAASLDPAPLSPAAGLTASADAIRVAAASARRRLPDVARLFRAYADEQGEQGSNGDGRDLTLSAGRRSQPLWADVEEAAVELDVSLAELTRRIGDAYELTRALPEGAVAVAGHLVGELGGAAAAVAAARSTLGDVALRADPELITWLRLSDGDVRVNVAPLSVAERLSTDLYAERDSVTATSATLTAAGSFDFSVQQLGLFEPETLDIGSPFDYRRAVLVLAVTDVPEPDSPVYAEAMHDALAAAATAAGGRTLALFTSHAAVRRASAALRGRLAGPGIAVLAQRVDGSPERLLRALVQQPRTLLLGTAALWEGIDVRGEALSQIVIARLPFPVPTDPIHAGRSARANHPFNDYTLPHAILRFRQGFGRLIRGSDERGVLLVLDRRLLSRRYGDAFLEALPDCELRRVTTDELSGAVSEWLAR